MNDDLPIKSPVPPTPAGNPDDEQETVSDRVFDISGDTIKPISEDELTAPVYTKPVVKPPIERTPAGNPPFRPTPTSPSIPPIPNTGSTAQSSGFIIDRTKPVTQTNTDHLDKKIGSFETTPFAPAQSKTQQNTSPTTFPSGIGMPDKPLQPPYSPKPTPTPQPITKTTIPAQKTQPASVPGWSPYRPTPPVVPKYSPNQTIPTATPTAIPTATQSATTSNQAPNQFQPIANENKPKTLQEVATAALPSYLQNLKPKASPQAPVETPQPFPTQTQSPAGQPKISSDPKLQQNLKPIRTYESDIAEMMSRKRTSMANVAIAESKKQEGSERIGNTTTQTRESSHSLKKFLLVIMSLVLLFGGVFGAYYLYSISPIAPVEPTTVQQTAPTSIIPSDSRQVLTLDSESPVRIQSQIANIVAGSQAPGTIKEIVIASKSGENLVRTPSSRMMDIMEIDAPDILRRSLTNNWMLGVYNNMQNEKDVFVVLTTNFFQNTFAGMLQWERVMADDIKGYIYPSDNLEGISNTPTTPPTTEDINPLNNIDSILPSTEQGTTTATSSAAVGDSTVPNIPNTTSTTSTEQETEPLRTYFTIRGTFEDRIIKNKDVRAFRTTDGDIIFLYSFIDNKSLIVTGKEETLTEIITRLEKQSFIR